MAAPKVANILTGPAVIWYRAPVPNFSPADMDVIAARADFPSPWERFGYTEGPTAFKYTREEKEVTANEALAALLRFSTFEAATFSFALKEVNPATFNRASGLAYSTTSGAPGGGHGGYEQFTVGGIAALETRLWCISAITVTDYGLELPVRLYIWLGTAKITDGLEWEREGTPKISVEIAALQDDSHVLRGEKLFGYRNLWAPWAA